MPDINDLIDLSEELEDVLDELDDMFYDLSIDGPNSGQLYKMYGVFLNDLISNPIVINGKTLMINSTKSRHPICRNKMQGFEHIITRESKLKGQREFDRERANKIHWIKPIIENRNDSRIKYFEAINDEGFNQQHYWYEDKGFIVIIREISPELMLITSFSIDIGWESKYRKMYNDFN
jgi:hypothetical protein